jgi:hypothetical protein
MFRRVFWLSVVTTVAGCSTVPVTKVEPPQNWYCSKMDGRGETGANVECRSFVTDPFGQKYYDGPPVPLKELDPDPVKERTGFRKFCHNYCGAIIGIVIVGGMVAIDNHAWNVNNH